MNGQCFCTYYHPCCKLRQHAVARSPAGREVDNEFNFVQHVAVTCNTGGHDINKRKNTSTFWLLACSRLSDSGGATPIIHSPLFALRASFRIAPPLSERLEQVIWLLKDWRSNAWLIGGLACVYEFLFSHGYQSWKKLLFRSPSLKSSSQWDLS